MSMELYIISDERLAAIDAWQRAIDADGYALRLSTSMPLTDVNGTLPVVINRKSTVFECTPLSIETLLAEFPDIHFSRRWTYVLALRWGGDIDAGVAAYMAAASYAKATSGVILDGEEGTVISAERARAIASEIDRDRSTVDAALRMVMNHYKK